MVTSPSARRLLVTVPQAVGVVLVGYDLVRGMLHGDPPLITVVAWLGVVGWVVSLVVPAERRPGLVDASQLVMIVSGSFVAAGTSLAAYAVGMVGLLVFVGSAGRSLRAVAGAVGLSAGCTAAGALVAPVDAAVLATGYSTLLLVALAALNRRQQRSAEAQARALLEERIAVAQERALVAGLSERSRIARDLHDVLAHSLGSLVIQLEAVDALLESGRVGDARQRVAAARQLAVSGLADAKQAVATLRAPDDDVNAAVEELTAVHRSLGGDVLVRRSGTQDRLAPEARTALHRAVQELLTNARRHAPGAVTELDLDWGDGGLTVTASTPVSTAVPTPARTPASPSGVVGAPGAARSPGGGNGLIGMRERVEAAGGTMSVRPGDGCGVAFQVRLILPRVTVDA